MFICNIEQTGMYTTNGRMEFMVGENEMALSITSYNKK